jgi:hypothetical protein
MADASCQNLWLSFGAGHTQRNIRLAIQEAQIATFGDELQTLVPTQQREVLTALKLKAMSLPEGSASSGQSVAALKVNVHRARHCERPRSVLRQHHPAHPFTERLQGDPA